MRVAVIGLGLIGGSLLRSLHSAGCPAIGYARASATRAAAEQSGLTVAGTVESAVDAADLVVVAVPLPAVGEIFDQLAAARYAGLVTDVTSVKGPVQELARRLPETATFIGGHPMAGKETSGFAASDATLLTGCPWVLCREPGRTPLSAWLHLAALVTRIGARVIPTSAARHDRAVAVISHVPHLLATALAAVAGPDPMALTLAAGSFRDGTRVAATRPELIAAMCGGNAAAVGPSLDRVIAELTIARQALTAADPVAALVPAITPGHLVRAAWPPAAGERVELPADIASLDRIGQAGGWIVAVAPDRDAVTAVLPANPA